MMKFQSEIKHSILLISIVGVLAFLAFTLEGSEINNISKIELSGNILLDEAKYLSFAQLSNIEELDDLEITVIRDRLEKHPYIKSIDVLLLDRGIVQIKIFEKKMDAVLLSGSNQYLVSDNAEIIPLIVSSRNIDLPVIVNNVNTQGFKVFGDASNNKKLLCALKIISTAELYDRNLYENISEINLNRGNEISLNLSNVSSSIYFGEDNEIEKTVFLSKIFKHLKGNNLTEYLNYVDLRYNEFVYLGFDEQLSKGKGSI